MQRFWDAAAQENAAFYVESRLDYREPDMEAFWAIGEEVVDGYADAVGVEVRPDATVLEIGCGLGRITRALAGRARHVIAVDVSERMLDLAREANGDLGNVTWFHNDGTSLAGIDRVDAVLSHVVFQHVPDPEITYGYVREMGRVLAPGGWAAFQVSNDPGAHRGARPGLRALLRRAPRGTDDPGAGRGHAVLRGAMRPSVIVPARDAAATLPATLDALAGQGAHEVIVVDDGSRDATRDLAAAHPVVTAVVDAPGTGPGGARNAGAAAASGDVLAFVDADCVPAPGWLAAGLRALGPADLVQGRVDPERAPGPYDRTLSVTAAWGLFESANLFVHRDLFDRLGGFEDWLRAPDERLLGVTVREKGLAEDVWFGWSARRSGATTAFEETARATHAVFAGSPRAYVAERLRLRHFPAIARRVPELRREFLFGRVFLSRRTAAFDLAVAALATRRPLALLAALPYVRILHRGALGHRRALAVHLAADAVGAVALVRGSVRSRSPVL